MPYKILIVDDDALVLATAKFKLEPEFEAHTANNGTDAIAKVKTDPNGYAAILVDFLMPEMDGIKLTQELLAINPHLVIAINSGDYTRETLKKCIASGAVDFIEKDTNTESLKNILRGFCKKYEETVRTLSLESGSSENEKLIQSIGMVGASASLANVAKTVRIAANADCTVLVRGESGTGKELIAHALHNLSNRKSRPFIALNINAIPENLLESDLFGHERGSFTGADRAKVGKIKLADGGTLFLDEIGDMKPDLQVKLLRVLQEGEISPVGSLQTVKVNVRIVAATHVDLERAVAEKRFREDLYYRLNVLNILLPPLRERPEDVQPLLAHFQKQFGGERKTILMRTVRYLERYPWPGNVRELENEMEKLMTIVSANRIEPHQLSGKFFEEPNLAPANDLDCSYEEHQARLEEMERQYILSHLAKSHSLRDAAKHRMKISHTTLHGRMKKLRITGELYETVSK